MKCIKENVVKEIVIKNSRFIGLLFKIKGVSDVDVCLENAKNLYRDANHYCYAYIIDGYKKFSDDGEPGGTAGNPILQVLEKKDLNGVMGIVVRYFGGIKLGAGGLVRAYTKTITSCLKECELRELIPGVELCLTFDYSLLKTIDYILKDVVIIKKLYDDRVSYFVNVDMDMLEKLKGITNMDMDVIREIFIEKEPT